jgi:predicted RNA-binding protein with PUA-like domain
MNYFLVKTEPEEYSFEKLLSEGKVTWDGVRNYQARNNLKLMKKGDQVLVYHSVSSKEIVGISEVIKEHYQDPTDKTGAWVVVDLKPVRKLKTPITLEMIKEEKKLAELPLIKQSRLSVMPISKENFHFIVKIGT